MQEGDTIAAVSSAAGPAVRMIVRLSGPEAMSLAQQFSNKPIRMGAWHIALTLRGMTVPAWAYVFAAPRSYTGEDLVELHIPGNPLLAKMLMEDLFRAGARPAEPGEFTARAYFNGRLDLSEAEGVAATIAAGNDQELAAARRLLSGELARRLAPALDSVAGTLALLEVGIDFSDEEVMFLSAADLATRIAEVDASLGQLLDESVRFERLSHEPTVVLVGRPNAGKSTLLNALAGQERAVVSPIAGTTRDVLSAEIALARGVIRLMDVAGLEGEFPPAAAIAAQMRQRAIRAIEEADHVILVRDVTDTLPPITLDRTVDLTVMTKADLLESPAQCCETKGQAVILRYSEGSGRCAEIRRSFGVPQDDGHHVATRDDSDPAAAAIEMVSARTGQGLDALRQALDRLCFGAASTTPALALNARHVEAIHEARRALSRAASQCDGGPEFIALELREAMEALGRIGGAISPDDLLGRIFSAFCIGK